MSTAVTYSGIDAMGEPRLRSLAVQIPHMQTRLRQVERIRISLDSRVQAEDLVVDLVGQETWRAGPRVHE